MKRVLALFLLLGFLTGCSCSKEEAPVLGPTEMWSKAVAFDPTIELVFLADTPEGNLRRVICTNYPTEGCLEGSGKRIKVRLVELLVLQYEKSQQACLAAQKIGQWYAYNWLFDEVTNEPVLEDFIVKAFDAKKPSKIEDCDF